MRTFLSILAGYAIFALSAVALFQISGAEPHKNASPAFMVGTTLYGMFFVFLAGYTATRIARRTDNGAGAIVMVIIAAAALGALIALPDGDSPWSVIATLAFMAPMALVGGIVARRKRPHRDRAPIVS
jgi:drug/metabolite transporter (DMT)-like permease